MADPKRFLVQFWAMHVKSLEEIFGDSNDLLKDVLQTAHCSYNEALGKTIRAFQTIRAHAIKSNDEKHQKELSNKEAPRDVSFPKVSKRKAEKACGMLPAVEKESFKFESGPSGSQDQNGEGSQSKKIKLDLTLSPNGKNGISEIKGTEFKPELVGRGSDKSESGKPHYNENEALKRELEKYKKENEMNQKLILILQKLILVLSQKNDNVKTKFENIEENVTALLEMVQELLEDIKKNAKAGKEKTLRSGRVGNRRQPGISSRLNEKDGCENQPNEEADIPDGSSGCYKEGA